MINSNSITVVIRSSNERTENVCRRLIEEQIPKENVFLIYEKPFFKAVKRTFQIGTEQGKGWTLAVDADILLQRDAVTKMIQRVNRIESRILDKLYVYQGYVVCKMFGIPRQAGLHLYQTKYLQIARHFITEDLTELRPESATYKKMVQEGYMHYIDNAIYGLHDYEQSFEDIYRKAFFNAKKFFKPQYFGELLPKWKNLQMQDSDYYIMLEGWAAGLLDASKVQVDIDFFRGRTQAAMSKLHIKEKDPLDESFLIINRMIEEEIKKYSAEDLHIKLRTKSKSLLKRVRNKAGALVIAFGRKIQSR